ncbi:MAG: S26 family signal peptidase [Clostridia bacterium]|nr:S26 family signal peptidase [Clostridia bacterium]
MEEKKSGFKKVLNVLTDVLVFAFVIVGAISLILTITSKRDDDGAINLFGMQMRIVVSNSMEKSDQTDVSMYKIKDIPIRSMIFIELVPEEESEAKKWYSALEVGDVVTFRYKYVSQETITHRIVKITEKDTGGYILTLEGDNKESDSNTLQQTVDTDLSDISPNYIIGKVTGQSRLLGFIVYSLKQPLSMVFLMIVPCAIIIIFEIVKIIRIFGAEKKQKFEEEKGKMEEEKQKQASEIEELKKQLAALQGSPPSDESAALSEETDSDEEDDLTENNKSDENDDNNEKKEDL